MEIAHKHISEYSLYGRILVILLFLTALTVAVAWLDFKELTIIIAMTIASVKAFLVMTYFMHLKYERFVFKTMVIMVFALLAVVFVLLFFDYWFR